MEPNERQHYDPENLKEEEEEIEEGPAFTVDPDAILIRNLLTEYFNSNTGSVDFQWDKI